MRLKTSLSLTAAAAIAAGGILAGIAIGHGGSSHPQLVVRQDAATSSVSSSPAPTSSATRSVAPVATVTRSKVAVKRPATVQEASVVTDPTTSADSSTPAAGPSDVKIEASYPNGESPVPPTGNLAPVSSPVVPPPGH